MIFASGYVELDSVDNHEIVKKELEFRGITVTAFEGDRMTFLIEKETSSEVKVDIESIKNITGIRNVYLAYFSLEGSDTE
ncbi:MAG TPA: hypothetical protein HPP56_04960 [Nitrospirae bacterium]|nr:hypothetical protein [Nitrospirota bacterium]